MNESLFPDSLLLYRQLKEPLLSLQRLLQLLAQPDPTLTELNRAYFNFAAEALQNDWPESLYDFIISDLNPFSQNPDQKNLAEAALWDLTILQKLAQISCSELKKRIQAKCPNLNLADWPEITSAPALDDWDLSLAPGWLAAQRQQLKLALADSPQTALAALQKFYREIGCGIFNQFAAFTWENSTLQGVKQPDPLKLENLINLEKEHQQILANTDRFVQGLPASNLILYGDRGSGKSSTVKALLHHYIQANLRLVELSNAHLAELPRLMRYLTPFKHYFIIFIDDLSFETTNHQYKWLKTALEGGITSRPANILLYVTSNRRHLIQENFKTDEIRPQDSLQEQMSLADRFGQTIIFTNPNQKAYLEIVAQLAKQAGLPIPHPEQALQWALWHNGNSGRTARQFIDHLVQK
ncbi:MAG: ATP-binding protein [Clostridia bacterium]|nr:ATP-binding protein [Clostridia bacterium]